MYHSPISSVDSTELVIFGWVGLGWLFVSQLIGYVWGRYYHAVDIVQASQWLLLIWFVVMVNLTVLAQLIRVVLTLLVEHEKKLPYTIQAFCWGTFKIICVGLFIGVLLKGYLIPTQSLMLGVGTFVVVPLLGGFFWSQRMLQHA